MRSSTITVVIATLAFFYCGYLLTNEIDRIASAWDNKAIAEIVAPTSFYCLLAGFLGHFIGLLVKLSGMGLIKFEYDNGVLTVMYGANALAYLGILLITLPSALSLDLYGIFGCVISVLLIGYNGFRWYNGESIKN